MPILANDRWFLHSGPEQMPMEHILQWTQSCVKGKWTIIIAFICALIAVIHKSSQKITSSKGCQVSKIDDKALDSLTLTNINKKSEMIEWILFKDRLCLDGLELAASEGKVSEILGCGAECVCIRLSGRVWVRVWVCVRSIPSLIWHRLLICSINTTNMPPYESRRFTPSALTVVATRTLH